MGALLALELELHMTNKKKRKRKYVTIKKEVRSHQIKEYSYLTLPRQRVKEGIDMKQFDNGNDSGVLKRVIEDENSEHK